MKLRPRRQLLQLSLVGLLSLGVAMVELVPEAQAGLATVGGEALDIKADTLNVDIDKGEATLLGNVRATLGELTVLCPKVEIRYDEAPQVRWARGSGGVEARLKGIVAQAAVVQVDVAERRVDLSGGVRLTRGKGWVEAGKASIDIATHKVTLQDVKGSIPVQPPAR
jgi:lipopolysaccharide export system protein LptA